MCAKFYPDYTRNNTNTISSSRNTRGTHTGISYGGIEPAIIKVEHNSIETVTQNIYESINSMGDTSNSVSNCDNIDIELIKVKDSEPSDLKRHKFEGLPRLASYGFSGSVSFGGNLNATLTQ